MKTILDLKITGKRRLTPWHFTMTAMSPEKLPDIKPGQFAEILVDNSKATFLRRPFSIHDVCLEEQTITFMVQIVGEGTRNLAYLEEGDFINVVFPLGNGFTISGEKEVLLIGGGCGVAPLLYLARRLHESGIVPSIIIGGKTEADLLERNHYENFGSVFCTTEDGSFGIKGLVTDHPVFLQKNYEKIYCCGPEPMMKAIAGFARNNSIECEVSLENLMACGIGACLCCVVDSVRGNVCTCTEGPVFNINELKW